MTAKPNNTEIAVQAAIKVATARARRWVSTATQVAARTAPPMAICPTSGTVKVSVNTVTAQAQTSIAAITTSNPNTVRDRTRPFPAAIETSTYRPAKKTNTALSTTLGPPSGSGVAGNQRHATMASSNARYVHALIRGNSVACGSQRIVAIPFASCVSCRFLAARSIQLARRERRWRLTNTINVRAHCDNRVARLYSPGNVRTRSRMSRAFSPARAQQGAR